MNRFLSCLSLIACFAATLFVPVDTFLWSQTTTSSGIPISWDGSCFYYSINNTGSDDLALEDVRQIARVSFDVWENVDCSYFSFVETEPTPVSEAAFHSNSPNVNLLVWRETSEEWSHGSTVVALTSVNYDDNTGEILDADIEFNGANCEFANLDEYPQGTNLVDMMNTTVHEIGHTVGLSHSENADATMYEWDDPGSVGKRDLTQDDIDGLCAIYPVEQDPGVCQEPYCGLGIDPNITECQTNEGGGSGFGCSVAGFGSLGDMTVFNAMLMLALLTW